MFAILKNEVYNKLQKGCDILLIEDIRKKLNITQPEMARELGISKRSYLNKVDGETDWRLNELIAISKLTDEDITIESGLKSYSIKIVQKSV